MKRQRGRGRKPGGGNGGYQPNRTLESNGPDVKVRGSASHIYEKYVQLSRDAATSGDRVASESYAQYAEHYFRMLRAMQPQTPVYEPQRFGQDLDYEQEEGGEDGGEGEAIDVAEGGEGEGGGQPYREQQNYRGDQRRGYQNNRQGGHPYQRGQQRDRGYQGQDGGRPRYEGQEGGDAYERGPEPERGPPDAGPREAEATPAQGGGEGDQPFEQRFGPEGGEDGARPNRRRRGRGRYRPQEGDRSPGQEGEAQTSGPVEGFGDTVPAFVGNE